MKYIDLTKTHENVVKIANLDDSMLKYISSIRTNDDFEVSNKPNCIYQYTTKYNPFSLEKIIFDSVLHINYDYFQENFEELIDKVCDILKELVSSYISLDKEFITKETMETIAVNQNINKVTLAIDSKDLLEVLEEIKHRSKEIPLNTIVINITEYNDLKIFINHIVSIYKDVKIIFNIDFKNFNADVLSDLTTYKNIVVKEEDHEIDLDLAIKKELKIRELLEPVETIKDKLSPFEIYTKLCQIVKDFKSYKEVEEGDDLDKSRTLSKLLFNEYIVCEGYVNLLQELCKRYNIETYYMSVDVLPNDTKDLNNTNGHARLLVKMKDDKYGIDGLYVSDPTLDSIHYSLYNHILMTFDEVKRELIGEVTFNVYDFLNVKNKEEFYALVNNPAARWKLSFLAPTIRNFDEESFEKICRTSSCHYEYDYCLEEASSLEKMADYCVNFHQEPINGNDILKALITIYKLEYPNIDDNQTIEHFKLIKEVLKNIEDITHPTIVTESSKEKIYDFYENKYSDSDVEDIVINERKNTR